MKLLQVRKGSKYFGGLAAIFEVECSLRQGEIFGLIGPNGAGKTTLFNCIAGYYHLDSGSVIFSGEDITSKPSYSICRMGISRTFQLVKIFMDMTVLENVVVPVLCHCNSVKKARREALDALELVGLADYRNKFANELTLVNRKFVDLAAAIASKPKVVMLDEVIAGLTPTEIQRALQVIYRMRDQGMTIFMIEHVMEVIMPLCDRVMVLNYGRKIAEGTPESISRNDEVIKAYLGDRYHAEHK